MSWSIARNSVWYSTIRPETPEVMYDLLRSSHSFWQDQKTGFLFRGHADASWPLAPSAWRSNVISQHAAQRDHLGAFFQVPVTGGHVEVSGEGYRNLYLKHSPYHVSEAATQLLWEFEQISEFYGICDDVGLSIPSRDIVIQGMGLPIPGIGEMLNIYTSESLLQWTPTPIFGLAQHHGIPTRLLDFSKDPKKALLFACQALMEDDNKSEEFCVWAIGNFYMMNLALSHYRPDGLPAVQFEFPRFPKYNNLFLNHQDGTFIFIKNSDTWKISHGDYPTIEGILDWMCGPKDGGPADDRTDFSDIRNIKFTRGHDGENAYPTMGARVYFPLAYKIVAPAAFARKLFIMLAEDRITGINLMPSYDNVVAHMRLKRALGSKR